MNAHVVSFLQMGGYAAYVWPAYLLAAAVLGGNVLWDRALQRKTHQQLLQANNTSESC